MRLLDFLNNMAAKVPQEKGVKNERRKELGVCSVLRFHLLFWFCFEGFSIKVMVTEKKERSFLFIIFFM